MVSSLKLPWPMNGIDNLLSQKNFNLVLSLVLSESIHPGKWYSPWLPDPLGGDQCLGLSGDLRAPAQPYLAPFKYLCTFSQNTMCTDNALTQCFESVSALNIWQAHRQVHCPYGEAAAGPGRVGSLCVGTCQLSIKSLFSFENLIFITVLLQPTKIPWQKKKKFLF